MSTTYYAKEGSLNEHVMTMRSIRDKIKRIGVFVPDDIFAPLLANSMPPTFPDVLTSSKGTLVKDPESIITTSDFVRALGAADVGCCKCKVSSEVIKVAFIPYARLEPCLCNFCYIRGDLKANFCEQIPSEKKLSDKDLSFSKKVLAREVEADIADVGFKPWDEPTEVTLSMIILHLDLDDTVFNTGANHNVVNSDEHSLSFKEIYPSKLMLVDGLAKSMIAGTGSVRIRSPFDESKSFIRH